MMQVYSFLDVCVETRRGLDTERVPERRQRDILLQDKHLTKTQQDHIHTTNRKDKRKGLWVVCRNTTRRQQQCSRQDSTHTEERI